MTHQNPEPELGRFEGFALQLQRFHAKGQVNDRLAFSLEEHPELKTLLEAMLEAIDRLREAMPCQEDNSPSQGTPQGMRIGISETRGLLGLLVLQGPADDGAPSSRD